MTSPLVDPVNGRALARTHLAHTWNLCPSECMSRLFLRFRCASLTRAPEAALFLPSSRSLPEQPSTVHPRHSTRNVPACRLPLARCTRTAHLLLPFASLTHHSLRSCMYAYVPNTTSPHHIGNVPSRSAHLANASAVAKRNRRSPQEPNYQSPPPPRNPSRHSLRDVLTQAQPSVRMGVPILFPTVIKVPHGTDPSLCLRHLGVIFPMLFLNSPSAWASPIGAPRLNTVLFPLPVGIM